MRRSGVNPWAWSTPFGFNQAVLVEGHRRELVCSGQAAVDERGRPQHPGDMGRQLDLAFENLNQVLREADMTLADVVRLNIYTTDVEALLANFSDITRRLEATGGAASTLLGVTRLAFPELLVEIEATAAR